MDFEFWAKWQEVKVWSKTYFDERR
jgi:hypothetical protein